MKTIVVKGTRKRRKRFYTKTVQVPRSKINGKEVMLVFPHLAEFTMDDIRNLSGIIGKCTMLTMQRLSGLALAARHIAQHNIEGDVVECGVAHGGSAIIMMRTLLLNQSERDIWLYDTYQGMPEPSECDVKAIDLKAATKIHAETDNWCAYSAKKVRAAFRKTCPSYPRSRMHFVEGKVEDTIPDTMPDKIALLHLDTDFYASTKHELEHLFPRLVPGGLLVIDDYGAWKGAKKAVDEYMAENDIRMFLAPIDYTQRIGIKES